MAWLNNITKFHGRLSDSKWVWWPFLFLKPRSPSTLISWKRLLIMTLCFGGWFAILLCLRILIFGDGDKVTVDRFLRALGTGLLTFLIWFSVVTRPLWNRRAERLP